MMRTKFCFGIGDQVDVFERIAVDENQVGIGTLPNHTVVTGIGIARPGTLEDLVVLAGRNLQHFPGLVNSG